MVSFRAKKKSDYDSFLEIDLKELFGKSVKVPNNTKFRQAIGQEVIDKIVDRTEATKYLSPAKQKYSKEYAETTEFQAFGKSKNKVNLTQSGDMLNSLDIIKEKEDKIVIGWTDKEDKAKATNHNFGVTVPKREFLGLTSKESQEIRNKFKPQVDAVQPQASTVSSVDNLQRFILGEFGIRATDTQDSLFARLFTAAASEVDDG